MKIGFCLKSCSQAGGGVTPVAAGLARELNRLRNPVTIFAFKDQRTAADLDLWSGVPNLKVFTSVRFAPIQVSWDYRSAVLSEELDVVHTHGLWLTPSAMGLAVNRHKGTPTFVTPHGMLDPWALRRSRWKKRLALMLYEKAHLHTAACIHVLNREEAIACREFGLENPLAIIPNAVDLPVRSNLSPPWKQSDKRVLLFLGRLHPKKGLTELLQAWKAFTQARAETWKLVIAGWDQNGYEAQLREQARDFEDVEFLGPLFKEKKSAAFENASAFVLPSWSEGFPMAVLEAWSYSLPVLMTSACNVSETNGGAVIVEPGAQGVLSGLRQLTELGRSELREMGERGFDLVKNRYTWSSSAAKLLSAYDWICNSGPEPPCVIPRGVTP